jgi:hypothetical protein
MVGGARAWGETPSNLRVGFRSHNHVIGVGRLGIGQGTLVKGYQDLPDGTSGHARQGLLDARDHFARAQYGAFTVSPGIR